jgi:hypothetical protein
VQESRGRARHPARGARQCGDTPEHAHNGSAQGEPGKKQNDACGGPTEQDRRTDAHGARAEATSP